MVEIDDFASTGCGRGEIRSDEVGGQAGQEIAVGSFHERGVRALAGKQGPLLRQSGFLGGVAVEIDAGLHGFIGNMPRIRTLDSAVLGNRHQPGGHFCGGGGAGTQGSLADKLDGFTGPRGGGEVPGLGSRHVGAGNQPAPETVRFLRAVGRRGAAVRIEIPP